MMRIKQWFYKLKKEKLTLFSGSSSFIKLIEVVVDYQQQIIKLLLNNKTASHAFLSDYFPVARLYHLFFFLPLYKKRFQKFLFIGGGGCCLPTYVYRNFPNKKISVVEIDDVLPQVATDFFDCPVSVNYSTFNQEGLEFLQRNKLPQDAIYIDIGLSKNYDRLKQMKLADYLHDLIKFSAHNLTPNGFLLINFMTSLEAHDLTWFKEQVIGPINSYFKSSFIFADNPSNSKFQDVTTVACLKKITTQDLENYLSHNRRFFSSRWSLVDASNFVNKIIN